MSSKRTFGRKAMLGKFDKGVKGAVSLNFCGYSGKYCSPTCKMHKNNLGKCYARMPELIFPTVKVGMDRRAELSPTAIVKQAIVEVEKKRDIPWFRFSVLGSVPPLGRVSQEYKNAFHDLVGRLQARGIPTHLPVETPQKAESYDKLVFGRCVVRVTCQSEQSFYASERASAFVAGCDIVKGGNIRKRRIDEAKRVAKRKRKKSGFKCIVCPGITHKAKCGGNCKFCVDSNVNVVYPLH